MKWPADKSSHSLTIPRGLAHSHTSPKESRRVAINLDRPMPDSIELLTAHHLPYRVVNIIENAQQYVVLVTAYLTSWTHLDHAIKATVARGVPITLVMRAPDGAKRDREKRQEEADALRALGVQVHFVERLHAKAYANEHEAIVTSFNLVSGSNESIELGVLIQDQELVRDLINKVRTYCPDLAPTDKKAAPTKTVAQVAKEPQSAFCIGCAEPRPFDGTKPMCLSCYRSSKKGSAADTLPRRSCHACGKPGPATLDRPICPDCWKALPKDVQKQLTAALG